MNNGTPVEPKKPKWYFTTTFLVIALLSVGPFALPLLWLNPRYSTSQKILWTVVTAALTWALVVTSVTTFKTVLQQYRELGLIK